MEWLLFAIGVAVIGLIGIGLGLLAGRAWARRAERRSTGGDDAFMTPVGPAPAEEPGSDGAEPVAGGEAPDAGRGDGDGRGD